MSDETLIKDVYGPDGIIERLEALEGGRRCRTCKWWIQNDGIEGGVCDKSAETLQKRADMNPPVHASGKEAFAAKGMAWAFLHTGPDFGCIHWENGS